MTYFGFLLRFLAPPILALLLLTWWDRRRGRQLTAAQGGASAWLALLAHVIVAVVYTTPWDNYLVATGVWYYNPALVTGVTLGWVPIEEYTFFVVQTLLSGLWLLWLGRHLPKPSPSPNLPRLRWVAAGLVGLIWLGSVALLASGWQSGVYLGLILIWALPPIVLQLWFGADILWQQRRLVFTALASVLAYLTFADALAIGSGTWTIDPQQSLNFYLGGVLPIEEFVFFLLTNTLIVFGMTLVLARKSHERAHERAADIRSRLSTLP